MAVRNANAKRPSGGVVPTGRALLEEDPAGNDGHGQWYAEFDIDKKGHRRRQKLNEDIEDIWEAVDNAARRLGVPGSRFDILRVREVRAIDSAEYREKLAWIRDQRKRSRMKS